MVVAKIHPYAADYSTGWTPSTPGAHWELVDEDIGSPDTSDYVYTDTDKAIDTYFMEVIGGSYPVVAATLHLYMKCDSGTQNVIPVVNIGGIDKFYPPVTITTTWTDYQINVTLDPSSNPWTTATISSSKWGVQASKPSKLNNNYLATLQLDVEYFVISSVPHAGI